MLKKWILLTSVLFLDSVGTSQAHPLDPPDIVYIDGMPCNSACQSYMAWSRRMLSMSGHPAPTQLPQRSANEVAHRATRVEGKWLKPAAHAGTARQALPFHREMPRAKVATLQPAGNAAAKPDVPPDKASAAASSIIRTIQEQVATALAEHGTAAAMAQAPEQKSSNTGRSNGSETVPLSDAEKKASAPNANNLVALLMARPEIKSVSDLTNKKIAIDDRQSASNDSVRTAIAAAGATEVQLSSGQTRAIDRLISGEVPAAVLTSAYPETSEWFPEIAGFKIFRIPLSPRSSQARLETAGKAATGSDSPPTKIAVSPPMAAAVDPGSRTIQERVAAATALAERVTAASGPPAAQKEASNAEASGRTEALTPSDTEPTASVPTNNTDDLVALMMARPEIKLVSDLTGKEVAIDYQQSGPGTSIRTAIAAAGAVEVQLNEGHTKAIDRLIAGEVPAAILTLVSPEAAEWFPDIPGYRIFRIPLSPRSLKTRL
jgi:hypothetical protein